MIACMHAQLSDATVVDTKLWNATPLESRRPLRTSPLAAFAAPIGGAQPAAEMSRYERRAVWVGKLFSLEARGATGWVLLTNDNLCGDECVNQARALTRRTPNPLPFYFLSDRGANFRENGASDRNFILL